MPLNVIVDLSRDDPHVDFAAAAKAGIVGVIHKASEGVGYVDPLYAKRAPLARAAGLYWGAYHFGTGKPAGADQADFFLATAGLSPQTLLVLDFEENPNGPSISLDQARAFVTRIHARTGRWPGLYAGSYLREQLGNAPEPVLTRCWMWLAEYAPAPKRLPPQWSTWTLWQYTDGGIGPEPHTAAGIGACDRSQFNGDEEALRTLWGVDACGGAVGDDQRGNEHDRPHCADA